MKGCRNETGLDPLDRLGSRPCRTDAKRSLGNCLRASYFKLERPILDSSSKKGCPHLELKPASYNSHLSIPGLPGALWSPGYLKWPPVS